MESVLHIVLFKVTVLNLYYMTLYQQDFETGGNGCYDCTLLYDQVQKLPFHDHNAPPLRVLVAFCKQATSWLNQDPSNIVAVIPRHPSNPDRSQCYASQHN
jgi:hypothetical protein